MDVILYSNVKGLGRSGDVVKVAEGYFRNFLKPHGLADEANASNIRQLEKKKQRQTELAAAQVGEAREIAAQIEGVTITIKAKAGEGEKLFGSVTKEEIARALKANGFIVEKKQIETREPIRKLGEHVVHIDIHPEVTGTLKLLVERA